MNLNLLLVFAAIALALAIPNAMATDYACTTTWYSDTSCVSSSSSSSQCMPANFGSASCVLAGGSPNGNSYRISCSPCTYGCSNGACNPSSCTPSWSCSSWSACSATYSSTCSNSATGTQTRTCTDLNNCGTTSGKPTESQSCTITRSTDGTVCSTGNCVLSSGTCGTGSRTITKCSSGACTASSTESCTVGCSSGYTCSGGSCIATTDATPPTVSVSISPSSPKSTDQITFTTTATDNVGVSKTRVYIDENGDGDYADSGEQTECLSSTCSVTKGPYTAGKTINYYGGAYDTSNNFGYTSISSFTVLSGITDTTPPTGSIIINNGAASISFLTVTLSLSCSDSSGCSQMKISNTLSGISNAIAESYTTTKSWTLESGPDDTRAVYVVYRDGAGNWMPNNNAVADTIELQTIKPTCSAPGIPSDTSIRCQNVKSDQISFGWNAVTGTTSYKIEWCPSTATFGSASCGFATQTSGALYTATGLSASTTYNFRIRVETSDGTCTSPSDWSSTGSCATLAADITPPTGSISINGGVAYTSSTSVTLSLSCTDAESGCSKMKIANKFADIDNAIEETYITSKPWALTSGDGGKVVYVKYKNGAGLWSNAYSDTITLDTIAPTSSITSPSAGSAQSSNFPVTVTDSDDTGGSGLYSCNYYVYDTTAGYTVPSGTPRACNSALTITVGSSGNCRTSGSNTCIVGVSSKDYASNQMYPYNTRSFSITLDTTPPVRSSGAPSGYISTTTPTLSLTTDEVATCKYSSLSTLTYDGMSLTFSTTGAKTHSQLLSLSGGAYTFYIKCKDSAGNNNTDNYPISFTIDPAPPTVGSISPTSAIINTATTFSAAVSDTGSGVLSCALWVDGSSQGGMTLSTSPCFSCTASKSYTFSTAGTHTMFARCADAVNSAVDSPTATVTANAPDTTAPTITISLPTAGSSVSSPFDLTATTNEDATCKYDTSGAAYDSIAMTASALGTSHSWSVSTADGAKTYYVKCKDRANNVGSSSVSFTVTSATPPVILYTNSYEGGSKLNIFTSNPDIGSAFRNTISSIRITSGGATLYQDINYGRGCRALFSSVSDLNNLAFNDESESVKLWNGYNGAILYQDSGFSNRNNMEYFEQIDEGGYAKKYNLNVPNPCIGTGGSSIQITSGYLVAAYKSGSTSPAKIFVPPQVDFGSDSSLNDQVYAIRVCRQSATNCMPTTDDTLNPYVMLTTSIVGPILTGTTLTFNANMADNYWLSECHLYVNKPDGGTDNIPMTLVSPTVAFVAPVGYDYKKTGSASYPFTLAGTYGVGVTCSDLSGRLGHATNAFSITAATPTPCGSCIVPRSLGTLTDYGKEISSQTCGISSTATDDIFAFTANKPGYVMVSVTDPVGLDTKVNNVVKYSYVGDVCSGTIQSPPSATDYFNANVVSGDYSLDIKQVSGSGKSTVKVVLGECMSNDIDTNGDGIGDRSRQCNTPPIGQEGRKGRCVTEVGPSQYRCEYPTCRTGTQCNDNYCCGTELPGGGGDYAGQCKSKSTLTPDNKFICTS